MILNPPENTIMVLESEEIYDGWSAALLSDGSIINRWDRNKSDESSRHFKTIERISQFLKQQEARGFEDEPEE